MKIKYRSIYLITLVHIICMFNANSSISLILMILAIIYSLVRVFKRDTEAFWAMIIIGSYNSNFPNIYTIKLGISIVYWIVLYFVSLELIRLPSKTVNKKAFFLIAPLFILFPVQLILGYLNRYSTYLWLIDIFSFSSFLIFTLYGLMISKDTRDEILNIIKQYVLIIYPLLVIFSAIIYPNAPHELFYDEFSKFHAIAFFPILFFANYKLLHKLYLLILYVLSTIIITTLGYASSLNFILTALSILIIAFKTSFKKSLIVFTVIFIILVQFSVSFYNNANRQTQYKIKQIKLAYTYLIEKDVASIPFSPKVRVLEIMNSFAELNDNYFILFTGKGFGSYFTYKNYTLNKYGITKEDLLERDAYPEENIKKDKFPRGHGFLSYMPIKLGLSGLIIFTLVSILSFFIKDENYTWLTISFPFYILTTFGYGYKNFIFTGIFCGIILAIYFQKNKIISD